MIEIPGMTPRRRVIQTTTDGHVTIGVQPPPFMKLPEQQVTLTADQYQRYGRWLAGKVLIQNALPDLTRAEREILMSGIGDADFHRLADEDDQ